MTKLGFQSCKADPNVWFRPSTKSDGTDYYQYVLIYTDDILEIMEEPERFLCDELGNVSTLKEKSIGQPTQYLGNNVSQVTLENGTKCCSFSSSQYFQSAVKNVEDYCDKQGLDMLPKVKSPWPRNYCPEVDVSTELSSIQASRLPSRCNKTIEAIVEVSMMMSA